MLIDGWIDYIDMKMMIIIVGINDISIIRIEQLAPFPWDKVAEEIAFYPNAKDVLWAQEEPSKWMSLICNFVVDDDVFIVCAMIVVLQLW